MSLAFYAGASLSGPGEQWAWLVAAVAVVAAAGIYVWWRRRPRDPAEMERRRRSYLNQVGRIVEGQVMEISDAPAPQATPRAISRSLWRKSPGAVPAPRSPNGGMKLVYYSYSISGVTYETAQDITGLEERACLERVVAGQHVSVKYDPVNPGNSILISDDWSGLH